MIGRFFPAALVGVDLVAGDVDQRRRAPVCPPMIEPAAAIGEFPVSSPIAPPGVELFIRRVLGAGDVSEPALGQHALEPVCLHRRMAHHIQQLAVRPHIVLSRRNIDVAGHQQRQRRAPRGAGGVDLPHAFDEIELVGKLLVGLRIRDIRTGRHVKILHLEPCDLHRRAARMPVPAEPRRFQRLDRQPGDNGDAVHPLLTRQVHVSVTRSLEGLPRKLVLEAFDLLQAQDISLLTHEESDDAVDAEANRIDVPGRQGQAVHVVRKARMRGVAASTDHRVRRSANQGKAPCGRNGRLARTRTRLAAGTARRVLRPGGADGPGDSSGIRTAANRPRGEARARACSIHVAIRTRTA